MLNHTDGSMFWLPSAAASHVETDFDQDLEFDDSADRREALASALEQACDILYGIPVADRWKLAKDFLERSNAVKTRKSLVRELARITNKTEKEVQNMPVESRARIYARKCYEIAPPIATAILVIAVTELYSPLVTEFLNQINDSKDTAVDQIRAFCTKVPSCIFKFMLGSYLHNDRCNSEERKTIEAILNSLPKMQNRCAVTFTPNEASDLTALELYLIQFCRDNPVKGIPLVASLAQVAFDRSKNHFLFAITDCRHIEPKTLLEKSWRLAGQLYRWGDDDATVDKPFEPRDLLKDTEVLCAIFSDPKMLAAQNSIGEYLLRQLLNLDGLPELFNILPDHLCQKHRKLLHPMICNVTETFANIGNVEEVRRLFTRFPSLSGTPWLLRALRRSERFTDAIAEYGKIKTSSDVLMQEKLLAEATIKDGMALEIPENEQEQAEMRERLILLVDWFESETVDGTEEFTYCVSLGQLLDVNRFSAEMAYSKLEDIKHKSPRIQAYGLLASLVCQNPADIDAAINNLKTEELEIALACIPMNLFRAAIRGLILMSNVHNARRLTEVLYSHMPELLDPLLGIDDFVVANPALISRVLDKSDNLVNPLQRWSGYTRAMELAAMVGDDSLIARAVDCCLAIKDPLLVPHQVKLLQERITHCQDADLKELLIEKLAMLSADESKPFLYQLLQTCMGKDKSQDALRILETLQEMGETTEALQQYRQALQIPSAKGCIVNSAKYTRPVSVGFFGGDECDKVHTEQLGREMTVGHPGLTVEFDHSGWESRNLSFLINKVARYDVIVASNLMRTEVNRGIRKRTRELGKTFGFCRNRGKGQMEASIMRAVLQHLARKI